LNTPEPINSDYNVDSCTRKNRWRVIAASVVGASHERRGQQCQDANRWMVLEDGTLVAAVADGAGSVPFGDVGSSLAVHSAVEAVAEEKLPSSSSEDAAWVSYLTKTLGMIRNTLESEADKRKIKLSELATTIILVICTREVVVAAQIGDGAVIVDDGGGNIFALTIPQNSEYINETNFITMQNALGSAQIVVHRGTISNLALISDGLQMLALQRANNVPHQAFFFPLFHFVSSMTDEKGAEDQLVDFLRSPRIKERTDDDITLLLANLGV